MLHANQFKSNKPQKNVTKAYSSSNSRSDTNLSLFRKLSHCLLFLENSLQELEKEMYSFSLWHIQEFHFYPVSVLLGHAVNQQGKIPFINLAK